MKNKSKFNIGDTVQSAPDSSDVKYMKAVWVAVIQKHTYVSETGANFYDTVGVWKPIKDADGNVSDFWKEEPASTAKTLRILGDDDLVKI